MNPYTTGVVNEMERLQQQNIQRNLMPQLKAGFVGSGGLGSQRYANALGQSAADMQSNLLGAQTGALQQGYAQALQAAINEGQMQTQAAQLQGNLGAQAQALGLAGAGAMTKAGAEQQAFEQAKINAPLTQATNVSSLLKGYTFPASTTETYKGPLAGAYGTSPLSQIAGLGALIGSGTDPKNPWLKNILSNLPSASDIACYFGGGDKTYYETNANPNASYTDPNTGATFSMNDFS